MKPIKSLAVALGMAVAMASGAALADRGYHRGGKQFYGHGYGHGHSHRHSRSSLHLGFVFGGPLWYPGAAYYPYPAYPPAVIIPPAPRVYVERDDQPMAYEQTSSPYWYYCRESDLYYPYAKECAGQWEHVPARPQTP
jgi:hypothetical protein